MKCEITNRIIIIGGNHQNTLAAIRCFGICKCNIHVVIHAEQDISELYCAKTKFSVGKTSVVDKSEDGIIQWLLYNNREEKQIIFPCSDLAAYVIDKNYGLLSSWYFIPGFIDNPGKVCSMMSKWEQKTFAEKYDIPMANSWLVEKNEAGSFDIPKDITFPCIVKPNTSAFGVKSDITICENENILSETMTICSKKNYSTLIIQDYLDETEEYGAFGCIVDKREICISDIVRKIYANSGNTVYAQFNQYDKIRDLNNQIINILHQAGYRGLFDIEYLVSKNVVYLLEINFRHSGIGFGQVDNKVYAPYLYCLSILRKTPNSKLQLSVPMGKFLIDETVCFTHRKQYGLSILKWLKICLFSSAHAKFNIHDIKGSVQIVCSLLRK